MMSDVCDINMSINSFREALGLPNLVDDYLLKGYSGWHCDSDKPRDLNFNPEIEKKEDGTECLVINW